MEKLFESNPENKIMETSHRLKKEKVCIQNQSNHIKMKRHTLSVKARPSRPSGKSTVNSFLSALTTTLEIETILSNGYIQIIVMRMRMRGNWVLRTLIIGTSKPTCLNC